MLKSVFCRNFRYVHQFPSNSHYNISKLSSIKLIKLSNKSFGNGGFAFENDIDDDDFNNSSPQTPNDNFSQKNKSNFNFNFDNSSQMGSYDMNSQRGRQSAFSPTKIEWSKENLIPFKKDFYEEPEALKNRSDMEINEFRKKNNIQVFGENVPKPFETWEESGIPQHCYEHIKRLGQIFIIFFSVFFRCDFFHEYRHWQSHTDSTAR